MKKLVLSIVFALGLIGAVNAQVDSKAIGLRFGGWGTEISYQHPLSSSNRVEANLGFLYGDGFTLNGIYQWVWDLSVLAPGVNWYAGAGASIGSVYSNVNLALAGQVGIEYNFKEIPIQISLDYRPSFFLMKSAGFIGEDGALSIRYKF